MVSKLLLVVTSIFLSSSIATNTNSFSPEASIKKVASVGTLKDENWVPYYYDDFERFSLDATQDDIFNNSFIFSGFSLIILISSIFLPLFHSLKIFY